MPASITTGYPTRIEFFFQSVSMFFLHNDYKIYSASCCYYFFFFLKFVLEYFCLGMKQLANL